MTPTERRNLWWSGRVHRHYAWLEKVSRHWAVRRGERQVRHHERVLIGCHRGASRYVDVFMGRKKGWGGPR